MTQISKLLERPAYQYLLLALITLLAVALRLYKLGDWSFWGDEIYTIRDAKNAITNPGIKALSPMLTGLTLEWLGTSEWSARLVSALIGAVSIPLLFWPVRKIFTPGIALLSCLLFALSPWHLYWSQNARFYTSMLLLYTLALFAFYFWLEENRFRYLVAFFVFLGLAMLERMSALFIVPVLGIYVLALLVLPIPKPAGLTLRNLLILIVPGALLMIFLIGPRLDGLLNFIPQLGRINNNPFWIVAGVVFYVTIPVILLGTAGIVVLLMQRSRSALLLGSAAIVPIITMAIISMVSYSANRYAFITLSSWLVLAGVAAVQLVSASKTKLVAVSILLLLMLEPLSQNFLYYRYQNGNRDDWKGAIALVERHRQEGDVVAVAHSDIGKYYLGPDSTNFYNVNFDEIDSSGRRIWFIEDMNVAELAPEKAAWLRQHAQLVAVHDVHVEARQFLMRVYLYDPSAQGERIVLENEGD
jgi:4-amino-4-deoxy-L-arabinose transferase-like glycosyltransferase